MVALYILSLGVSVGHLVFLMFNTNFIAEYGKLLRLSGLLKLNEYKEWASKPGNEGQYYPIFFRETRNSFIGRLVGCPYCLITFLCVLLALPLGLVAGALGTLIYQSEHILYRALNK